MLTTTNTVFLVSKYTVFLSSLAVLLVVQKPLVAFQLDTTDTVDGKSNGTPIYNTFYQNGVSSEQIGLDGIPTYFSGGTHDVGDYSLIGELSQNTGLGNILEVLVYNNSSGANGAASGTGTIESLADTLSAASSDNAQITETTSLVLGLGVNQTGNNPNFSIETLNVRLQIPNSGCAEATIGSVTAPTCTFSVGTPGSIAVTVLASGGNNSSEARVQMDLDPYLTNGNDFFSTYNYYNTDNTVNTTATNTAANYNYEVSSIGFDTAGNDRFFLSSGLTSAAEQDFSFVQNVPFEFSPGLGILASLGLLSGFHYRKQILSSIIEIEEKA